MRLPAELERRLKARMREEVDEMSRMLSPLFEEEYERGREEGLKEGIRQGIQQGVKDGLLRSLEVMLKMRFGIEGLKLVPELRKLPPERLEVIVEAMPDLKNIDELRDLMS